LGRLPSDRQSSGSWRSGNHDARTAVFVVIWFVVAAVNMWLGVSKAGYSFREELPIFLLIFLLPVIVAVVLVKWKFF
jgi:hypothetical protein